MIQCTDHNRTQTKNATLDKSVYYNIQTASFQNNDATTLMTQPVVSQLSRKQLYKQCKQLFHTTPASERKCKKCNIIMTQLYGSGQFCSRKCSNSRTFSEETKHKTRVTLANTRGVPVRIKPKPDNSHLSPVTNQRLDHELEYSTTKNVEFQVDNVPKKLKQKPKITDDCVNEKNNLEDGKVLYQKKFKRIPTTAELTQYIKNRNYAVPKHKQNQILRTSMKRKQGKCENCDETDDRLFDLAHYKRGTKRFKAFGGILSTKGIMEESKLGRFLCNWCHRLETKDENDQLKKTIDDYKTVFIDKSDPFAMKCSGLICQGNYIHISNFSHPERKHHICRKCTNYKQYLRHHECNQFILNEKMKRRQCVICKIAVTPQTSCCFDFDHIIHADKKFSISGSSQKHMSRVEVIIAEMAKCQLLCCKCHRLKTLDERNCTKY